MNTVRVAAVLLVAATVIGCQAKKSQQRRHAPTSAQDVGIVLETVDRAVVDQLLATHPNAQMRELNPKHGMYEIFGVSHAELAMAAPMARLSDNSYFSFRKLSIPAPAGLEVEGLNPCRESEAGPTSVATVTEPAVDSNEFTVEVGSKVVISAANSSAHPAQPGAIKTAILMIPPGSSSLRQQVTVSDNLEITTDALGAYQIFVVTQDSQDSCALDGVRFIATANRPYQRTADTGRVDLNRFTHLQTLNAPEAWTKSSGEGVLIAIVDTGVNYNHPLLSGNMDINNADHGNDEDGNGLKGDQAGYDFINSDPFPYDDDSHGTHVAGLAAARQFGMAKNARILAVKSITSFGGDAGSIAAGVMYAVDRGAKIINMSLGAMGSQPHPLIVRAMDYANSKNVLVVVASGNGDPQTGIGIDIDQNPVWPASLPHENVLSVAALDKSNVLTPYSNYGKVNVDVSAPGGLGRDSLVSTAFENPANAELIGMSGTSMAAPIVSGIAAQVLSLNPNLKATDIKAILMKAGAEQADLQQITASGRRLNALEAVNLVAPANALF